MHPKSKRKTAVDPVHAIWRKLRGPFRVIKCREHRWERYDVQKAGCLSCGAHHKCEASPGDGDCQLVRNDDCSICCTITGFCLPTVRYSDCEYVEGVSYGSARCADERQNKIAFDEVLSLVKWFLSGSLSTSCKRDEVDKTISRIQCASIKALKFKKLQHAARKSSQTFPCILSVIAQTLHQLRPKLYCRASNELCAFCAKHISQCLNNLQLANAQNRKVNLILGMLYLMKQGLVIQNKQWLPRTPELAHCLPHETSLEKAFKLSMKLVCETENEIKLALRQQVKLI
jgi:hypothetical protein